MNLIRAYFFPKDLQRENYYQEKLKNILLLPLLLLLLFWLFFFVYTFKINFFLSRLSMSMLFAELWADTTFIYCWSVFLVLSPNRFIKFLFDFLCLSPVLPKRLFGLLYYLSFALYRFTSCLSFEVDRDFPFKFLIISFGIMIFCMLLSLYISNWRLLENLPNELALLMLLDDLVLSREPLFSLFNFVWWILKFVSVSFWVNEMILFFYYW
jgi:hypothetical protein